MFLSQHIVAGHKFQSTNTFLMTWFVSLYLPYPTLSLSVLQSEDLCVALSVMCKHPPYYEKSSLGKCCLNMARSGQTVDTGYTEDTPQSQSFSALHVYTERVPIRLAFD